MNIHAVEGGTAQQQQGDPSHPWFLAAASLALFGRTLPVTLIAHALAKADANVNAAATANVHETAGR